MSQINHSDLVIVFRNPEPTHDIHKATTTWLLYAQDRHLRIVVSYDRGNRPCILSKQAA
jgi:hypothetical protein